MHVWGTLRPVDRVRTRGEVNGRSASWSEAGMTAGLG